MAGLRFDKIKSFDYLFDNEKNSKLYNYKPTNYKCVSCFLVTPFFGSISTEHLPRPIEAKQAPKKRVDKEIVAHDVRVNMYRVWCGKRLGRRKWICMFELSMFF